MDYSKLDELVAEPKKTDASKAKIGVYSKEMAKLLAEEGVSEKASEYLRRGFGFAGAASFADYLKSLSSDRKKSELEKLLSSDFFKSKDNKPAAYRFSVSLLGYAVTCFRDDTFILSELVKTIPTKAKSKDGKLLKDAPRIVEKYFLSNLNGDKDSLPVLWNLGVKEIFVNEFVDVMYDALSATAKRYATARDIALQWIGKAPLKPPAAGIEAQSEENVVTVSKPQEDNVKACPPEVSNVAKPLTNVELSKLLSQANPFLERLSATIEYWRSVGSDLSKKQQQIDAAEKDIQILKRQLDRKVEEIQLLSDEKAALEKTVSDLKYQLMEARKMCEEKSAEIEKLKAEKEKLSSVISVYSADKLSSQTEQLNSIASKLKSEYRDFKDAESEEMTIDLGENFRFQLQSVFRILAKAGIDVEKR